MKNLFVTYEQAIAIKELGFDEPCFGFYDIFTNEVKGGNYPCVGSNNAPLKQQVFDFFREKYGYDISIRKNSKKTYQFTIKLNFKEDDSYHFIDFPFDTHEEASSACIDKIILTIKRKKDE